MRPAADPGGAGREGMMRVSDPTKLRRPENMTAAIVAKCHAQDQLVLIDAELKRLRRLRRAWNKRLGACLRRMTAIQLGRG